MKKALTFDDVGLQPVFNNVASRSEPELTTKLTTDIEMDIPIVAANMDTVIGLGLANILADYGSIPIYHRFNDLEARQGFLKLFPNTFISSGLGDGYQWELACLKEDGLVGVCFDIAQGHDTRILDAVEFARELDLQVIAGNVCTEQGYIDLVNAGANAVKVGIGPGAACTTRIVTGFGMPQMQALLDIRPHVSRHKVPVIADGGIRTSGDIVKALAAGASSVMLGKMFALTQESAAEKRPKEFKQEGRNEDQEQIWEACYKGQASKEYQRTGMTPEGIAMWADVTGSARDLLDDLLGGIRSGLTYGGSRSIEEFHRKVLALDLLFEVNNSYITESHPRS